MTAPVELACEGCGLAPPPLADAPYPFRCARASTDGGDHLLAPHLTASARWPDGEEGSPFERYRGLLFAHAAALELGVGDGAYLARARALADAVARVDGRGLAITPLARAPSLDARAGAEVLVKDETRAVSGSHKARHLFGIALHLEIVRAAGLEPARPPRLAVASCGNAALAAAVVARAAERPLDVYVPEDAPRSVRARLDDLGARVHVCRRAPGELGDPCVSAARAAVRAGALPFGCQGSDNGLALDGGRTLAFEVVDALREVGPVDRVFVQVGGGALMSSLGRGLYEALALGAIGEVPRLHPVQTARVAPVREAYARLARAVGAARGERLPDDPEELAEALASPRLAGAVEAELRACALDRRRLFEPWPAPAPSVAHGILDDDTYDGLALLGHTLRSGGAPVVVDEPTLVEAARELVEAGVDADETGAAGLAGLLTWSRSRGPRPRERVLVLATGRRR